MKNLLLIAGLLFGSMAYGAEGNLRYSVSVTKFPNESGWSGRWAVGDGFTTMLTDALQQSGNFIVLGDREMREAAMDEQDLVASGRTAGGKKAAQTGRMTPAQLLVRGSVTHVEYDTKGGSGGLNFMGVSVGGGGSKAEVNITIYLVDSETGQVKASQKVVGEAGKRKLRVGYYGNKLGGLTGNLAGFEKDNLGLACNDAVEQCVEFLVQQLETVPWEGSVMSANDERVIINRGEREGVAEGMTFDVGSIEELVDEDTGEVLDVEISSLGTISVTSVREKIAYCTPLAGVEKGMTVMPVR